MNLTSSNIQRKEEMQEEANSLSLSLNKLERETKALEDTLNLVLGNNGMNRDLIRGYGQEQNDLDEKDRLEAMISNVQL